MLLAQVITTALVFKSDLQTEIVAPETVVSICDWVLFVSFLIMLPGWFVVSVALIVENALNRCLAVCLGSQSGRRRGKETKRFESFL